MRICFIALGEFTHVDAYIDYFVKRGHETHFVALAPGPARSVPTYNVGCNGRLSKLLGKFSYLPSMLRARKVVRTLKPDIVHAHFATSAGLAARVVNIHPWIVTAHGSDVTLGVRSRLWRKILQRIFLEADCVNVVSDELREMVLGLGTPPEKIETFTFGIDTQLFRFNERTFVDPAEPLRLICTRRLEAVYDHATIIRSIAILKERGIRLTLTIIGDGIIRQSLESLASELRIKDQITFAGSVANSLLPASLAQNDIYLSASTRDGTSLCLLEAMASGVYPVVSDITANRAWIKHGCNGALHKVGDPQSLAECLSNAIRKPEDFKGALLHNRALVVKNADRATNMTRLENLYRHLCRQN